MPIIRKGNKRKRHKGSITICSSDLPEIKNWQVGEEYELIVKVKQTALREVDKWEMEEYNDPAGSIKGEFEIQKVMVSGEKVKKGAYVTKDEN